MKRLNLKQFAVGFVLLVLGLLTLYQFGLVDNLTCYEIEPGEGRCTAQRQWMGLFGVAPLQQFDGITRGSIEDCPADDVCEHQISFSLGDESHVQHPMPNFKAASDVTRNLNGMLYPTNRSEEELIQFEVLSANWIVSLLGIMFVSMPLLLLSGWSSYRAFRNIPLDDITE